MSVSHSSSSGARSKKQFFSYAVAFREFILFIGLNFILVWLDVPPKTLWIVLGVGILFVFGGRLMWRVIMR